MRPHQGCAVNNAIEAFDATPYGGGATIVLPCGFGKSVSALAIAERLCVKTLIVTHTGVLATQWQAAIQQYCVNAQVGTVIQDKFDVVGKTHVIGSLHSLAKRDYDWASAGFGLLVVDEA